MEKRTRQNTLPSSPLSVSLELDFGKSDLEGKEPPQRKKKERKKVRSKTLHERKDERKKAGRKERSVSVPSSPSWTTTTEPFPPPKYLQLKDEDFDQGNPRITKAKSKEENRKSSHAKLFMKKISSLPSQQEEGVIRPRSHSPQPKSPPSLQSLPALTPSPSSCTSPRSSSSRLSFLSLSPFSYPSSQSDFPSSGSPLLALSPRWKSLFSTQDSPPPSPPPLSSPSLLSFSDSGDQLRCDSYLDIINYLVGLSPEKIEIFFIGFEQSFDIDQFKLLETMKEMIITKEGEEQQNEKKEQIIQIVLSWRRILTPFYQTFNPLLSKAIEEFLDSLESTPFESTLIWKRMSLSSCGTSNYIAQMLTSFMFRRYKDLRPHEFYDGFWQKEEKYIRSPNIKEMSEIFNRISSMVVESILFCESETRSQNLMFMIKLATQLLKLRNFEGGAAVISGLNQYSIKRLKPLWKLLNSRYKKRFELFDEILSPESNFKNYQNVFQSSEPPLLPWFAPKLRELRYLYDANQSKTEEGFVNLPYLMKIGESIKSFLQYQSFRYDFPHPSDNSLLLIFLRKRSVPEEICYKQSLSLFEMS